jgi:hypothetical protein
VAVEFRKEVDVYILKRVCKCLGLKMYGMQGTISASAKMVI